MAVRPPNQALGAAPTGAVVLADGTAFFGHGAGAEGTAVGELCFNTAMTGYQEILTDPSYARQIVLFTFPHIGIVGVNADDSETSSPPAETAAVGTVLRAPITASSNWRADGEFDAWLSRRRIVAVTGVDTRAVTRRIREAGMPHAVVAHDPNGGFDVDALAAQARDWAGIEGADLARDVTTAEDWSIAETAWDWPAGHAHVSEPRFHVVVLDYGVKKNILRRLGSIGARATVMRANSPVEAILEKRPDGVLLANGPGDPAATAGYAADTVRALIDAGLPVFGICLGHQLLALALGAKTVKMAQGHHGANHPVKELRTGRVQIVSMNHGFAVDRGSLPRGVIETHVSLFDGTNCGLAVEGKPVFSVQHHPEASPGPHDAFDVFDRFAETMASVKTPA